MKDIGYANGWSFVGGTPEIVKKCQKKGHTLESKKVGNCEHEYWCEKCQYKYRVDSSG